jgi:hypothetical protein
VQTVNTLYCCDEYFEYLDELDFILYESVDKSVLSIFKKTGDQSLMQKYLKAAETVSCDLEDDPFKFWKKKCPAAKNRSNV